MTFGLYSIVEVLMGAAVPAGSTVVASAVFNGAGSWSVTARLGQSLLLWPLAAVTVSM